MAAVTGVKLGANLNGAPDPTPEITAFYKQVQSQLPLNGTVSELTPAMLLATTGLAGLFCSRAIETERILPVSDSGRTLFRGIDFVQNQSALTPSVRQAFIQGLTRAFWRRDPTSAESAMLSTAIDEALAGRPVAPAELRNAVLAACAAALSTTDFIKN